MLSSWEDNCEIYRNKNSFLDLVCILDEEIGTETRLVKGGNQMVKSDEALLELFGWVRIETSEQKGKNGLEVWLDGSPIRYHLAMNRTEEIQ